jgi:hypothetical protein
VSIIKTQKFFPSITNKCPLNLGKRMLQSKIEVKESWKCHSLTTTLRLKEKEVGYSFVDRRRYPTKWTWKSEWVWSRETNNIFLTKQKTNEDKNTTTNEWQSSWDLTPWGVVFPEWCSNLESESWSKKNDNESQVVWRNEITSK